MTISLDRGPQDAASLRQQLNVLRVQVNGLAGSDIPEALGPQDLGDYLVQVNLLIAQVNALGGSPAIAYFDQPDSPSAMNEQLNLLREEINGVSFNYHADAVHFDGSTWLINAALSSSDNGKATFAFFAKQPGGSTTFFASDPATYLTGSGIYDDTKFSAFFGNVPAVSYIEGDDQFEPDADTWFGVVASVDMAANNLASYINRVSVGGTPGVHPDPFSTVTTNSYEFWVGNDDGFTTPYVGDMANFMYWPGVSILNPGTNVISSDNLDLFFTADSKPVDPAVAIAALGTPAVALIGGASVFGTNRGGGGSFVTTGTLTDASTSPSD